MDAVFPSARDRLTFPELLVDGLQPHKVKQLWLGNSREPNVWFDITGTFDLKLKALRAHPSQLGPEIAEFAVQMGHWGAAGQDF